MSLQVWLPLNGNLNNQGLTNVTLDSGTPTYTNGKIGQCLSTGTLTFTAANNLIVSLGTNNIYTICCWCKNLNISTSSRWVFMLGSGTGTSRGLWESNNVSYRHWAYFGSGVNMSTSINTIDGDWHHICFTSNGSNVKLYVDGIQQSEITNASTTAMTANTFQLNATDYNLNDFRLYDHTLSQMEVKELAKGLILHYPLNRNGWGQDNILLNTGFQSRYTQSTGWDTTKNGTQLANSWGGYNSGVTNQATVYHAHLKEFNGEWVYEYIRTANESWLGISQNGLQSKLTAGKTYTFSWEEYHVNGTNRVGTGLYYFKTGATSANFHLGIQEASDITRVVGKWQKYTYTFIAPSDADWSKNMSWYIYGHHNGNGTFYMRHPKLEEGSIATPWCPNSADTLGTALNINGTTEYDCSGFGNNGTRTGTFSWTSDTPKYNVSTQFNSTSTKIAITGLTTTGFANSYSFAWWAKKVSNAYMDWGFSDGIRLNGMYTGHLWNTGDSSDNPLYNIGTTTQVTDPTLNVWHHYVMTGNGSKCYVYKDGVLWAEAKTYKAISGTTIYINGWNSSTSYSHTNYQMSDFRIYATALSASDVKSLYQNSAYIDSSGNVYGAIHMEA